MAKRTVTRIGVMVLLALHFACDQERGFSLPVGNQQSGRSLFEQYGCVECHTVVGEEFALPAGEAPSRVGVRIRLGGPTTKLQTYGDLVTSIINPSHRIARGYPFEEITNEGKSKMEYYNQIMTVEELIDLVTFLKAKYEFRNHPATAYPYFIYPG